VEVTCSTPDMPNVEISGEEFDEAFRDENGAPRHRPRLGLLQRGTPDQEPIRKPDQAKHEHEREHFQLRLSLLIRHFPKNTASATIALTRFLIHNRLAFAALLPHQSDYAGSPME